MNNQEALDQAYAFLKAQGGPSKSDNSSACYYRHPENSSKKCFVGSLISDEDYRSRMEITSLEDIKVEVPVLQDCSVSFLRRGQAIHDSFHSMEGWELEYKQLAADYNLDWSF